MLGFAALSTNLGSSSMMQSFFKLQKTKNKKTAPKPDAVFL
jgi:hypothetical protein